jgi:hypothetical protein
MLAAVIVAASASAAGKPYTVVLSPASIPGGESTLTATFANRTGQQQLGSANLTAPSGLSVLGATLSGRARPRCAGA